MDFDLQWLLIGLPVAFALGWLASRFDLRQFRGDSRDAPRAYFKGLNLLLNEQQDKAIDAFIEAVQNDPDTTELHFALGNLFRRRGEFERAVRVHQHLLQRADLKAEERDRAQHALAQDFMKAGLFDRAEEAWHALQGTAFDAEAQAALLSLYERSRQWALAADIAQRLERQGGAGSFGPRIAHHWCELAQDADARGQHEEAEAALAKAFAAAPEAPRPLVLAGHREAQAGRHEAALGQWDRLRESQPAAFMLVAAAYAQSALACGQAARAKEALLAQHQRFPAMDLLRALSLLEPRDDEAALQRLVAHLRLRPNLSAAADVLDRPVSAWPAGTPAELHAAIAQAALPQQRYRCAACGFEAQHYFWQCPGCLSWDSYPTLRIEEQ
jgi:lipopolysaccharide assembly protein B